MSEPLTIGGIVLEQPCANCVEGFIARVEPNGHKWDEWCPECHATGFVPNKDGKAMQCFIERYMPRYSLVSE